MKKVIIAAAQFPPCNLTAAGRSRYFAAHLKKFGWEPVVLTVKPGYYRGKIDRELEELLPGNLAIVRTKALPGKFLGIIGDIGLRSLWRHYKALVKIIKKERIDLIYIPIPPNYSAVLGPVIYKKFGIPYGIDYIDPWINNSSGYRIFSKGWLAGKLGRMLEPIVLKKASFITAVAPGYYQGALERYPWLDKGRCFSLPYGAEEEDFRYLEKNPRSLFLFNPQDGNFHIIYAGAMLPKAYAVLEALFQALVFLKKERPEFAEKLRIHFVGTGSNPSAPKSFNIKPIAEKYNLSGVVFEYPARIPYLDVLNHLKQADAVLILGSTEPHYTPSKVFQAIRSKKPVFAFLHKGSSAVKILNETNAGEAITFEDESHLDKRINTIKKALIKITGREYQRKPTNWRRFKAYSAEAAAKKLAGVFNRTLDKK